MNIALGDKFKLARSSEVYTFSKDLDGQYALLPEKPGLYPFVFGNSIEHAKENILGALTRGTFIHMTEPKTVKMLAVIEGVTDEILNRIAVMDILETANKQEVVSFLENRIGPAYKLGKVFIVTEELR